MSTKAQMKKFMEPESIAIIGASRRLGNGSNVLENLLLKGFKGSIYPVNPFADEICGIRVFPRVHALPADVDLALIMTPNDSTLDILKECADKNIEAVIIVGQGYADGDESGKRLQMQVEEMARRSGTRIVGPNTFGVANGFIGLSTAFAPFPVDKIPVGIICQTGLLFASTPRFEIVGKAVDLGNACDVGFSDVLEYYEDDTDIEMIVLYVERIKEGRRFMEVAGRVTPNKPIFALKGGKSEQGMQKVASHTGAMTSQGEIFNAVFKKCGIIQLDTFDELEDVIMAFSSLPLIRGKGIGIITYPMSAGILSVDACAKYGLNVPQLSKETLNKIGTLFPSWAPAGNPIDLTVPSFVMGRGIMESFEMIMDSMLNDPKICGVIFITPALTDFDIYDYSSIVSGLSRRHPAKPIVSWLYGPDPGGNMAEIYGKKGGVVVFPSLDRAIRTLGIMSDYSDFVARLERRG